VSILVAEDNPINIKFIQSLFEEYNIGATIAQNGKIAIEQIKNNNYDLLLMDIEMPEMNGYDTTKYIRNDLQNNIPIIAMTAHAMAGEKEKCLRLGMNDYISKPINAELLFKKMMHLAASKIKAKENNTQKPKLINLDFIVRSMKGKKAVIRELIDIFLQQVPEELANLNDAVVQTNYPAIKAYSHKMISSVSMLEVPGTVPILEEMENFGTLESNIEDIRSLNATLNRLCTQVLAEVQEERLNYV